MSSHSIPRPTNYLSLKDRTLMSRRKHSDDHNNIVESDSLILLDAKVKELREALGAMSGRSAKFCSDGCLKRYLETKNYNVNKAKLMLEETLKWRATYKPEEIRWDEVAHESETGKSFRAKFRDREGRTVLIMRAGKQKSKEVEGNLRHFVYTLENAILNLGEGQEQMLWLIDFNGFSINTNVSVSLARGIINLLQYHYPDRLTVAFIYDPPKIFEVFFKAVKYFLNPSTAKKAKFVYKNSKESVELMKSYFDVENLPKEFGGNATLEYNHAEYSRLMVDDEKKAAIFWGIHDSR